MDKFPMYRGRDCNLEMMKQIIPGRHSFWLPVERTPLHLAAADGRYEDVDFLSSLPECDLNSLDSLGCTPIMLAAIQGKSSVVDLLLQRGAQVNCADHSRQTLLHHASRRGCADLVLRILDQGVADLNAATRRGDTPLVVAAKEGHEVLAAILIRAGADVNRSGAFKKTALHWAAMYGRTELAQVLLKKEELDINYQDENGQTPLHSACFFGRQEVVHQLLVAGADTTLKNHKGETALSKGIYSGGLTFEDIRLFVQQGEFLQDCDYVCISQDPLLRQSVLKNVSLCTRSIVNKFHRQSLPALNSISYFARKLPNIDRFQLKARQIDDVENLVKCEIDRNTFCNVVKAHPMALSALCVLSLITCRPG